MLINTIISKSILNYFVRKLILLIINTKNMDLKLKASENK